MHVRVCLRVRTSQVVCFLDLDKCTIYGQDGNDLAIAMQVCVCVGGGGGSMCVTSRLHFHTRTVDGSLGAVGGEPVSVPHESANQAPHQTGLNLAACPPLCSSTCIYARVCVCLRMHACMHYGWMDGWMDGWMNERKDVRMRVSVCECIHIYVQTISCTHSSTARQKRHLWCCTRCGPSCCNIDRPRAIRASTFAGRTLGP